MSQSRPSERGSLPSTQPPADPEATRAGYVTLLGPPNAGKSTFLNRAVGEALSIVTPLPQTTWQRVTGLLTRDGVQFIFLDTPGLLEPRDLLQRSLLSQALQALSEADVLLLLMDPLSRSPVAQRAGIVRALKEARSPIHVAVNKADEAEEEALAEATSWAKETVAPRGLHLISARTGEGMESLLDALAADLPESPFLYPADEIAAEPVRFFVAEMVRETVMERFRKEIPYAVFSQVEEFRRDGAKRYIQVHLYVERKSQKGILIGEGGRAIREVGREARTRIEHFLGEPVYLDLWVKVLPGWRKKRGHLRRLGFSVPDDHESP